MEGGKTGWRWCVDDEGMNESEKWGMEIREMGEVDEVGSDVESSDDWGKASVDPFGL